MTSVIKVENLGKKYIIGHQRQGSYVSLRDVIADKFKSFGKKDDFVAEEEFWALKDVSFEIKQGDRVGIIGRNGAGKSTLLKILSRITEPTTGRIAIKGRVASLLEVGTGFHSELTGRENIFLNGAILGMSRVDIKKNFDEIVAFAEVEKFLDTPVKRYSSGMYVRLAFAVAAHLEPEILIVDEVLAVGDAQFQKKCLGKMEQVGKEGRTVLFVSHNMAAIKSLCELCILLSNGHASHKLSPPDAISQYSKQGVNDHNINFPVESADVIIHNFRTEQNGYELAEYVGNLPININIDFEVKKDLTLFRIGVFIKNSSGELLIRSLHADWDASCENIKAGRYLLSGEIPDRFFVEGNYLLQVHSSRYGIKDYVTCERTTTPIKINFPHQYNPAHIGERPFGIVILSQNWNLRNI